MSNENRTAKENVSTCDIQKELLELIIKAGRRMTHDFKHMLDEVPNDNPFKNDFQECYKQWMTIFYADNGPKDYRSELHLHIDRLEISLNTSKSIISRLESENRELQKEIEETRSAWKKDRDDLQVKRLVAEKELIEAKELISKADSMYKAFDKTLRQLAADGVALEGFTESWAAVNEFHQAKIESFLKDK